MRHWTHDGAYLAAFGLLAVGCAAIAGGVPWPGVAACGAAVALLLGFRAMEAHTDTRKALDVSEAVTALRTKVSALAEAQTKTAEDASTALRGLATVRPVTRPPGY